MKRKVFVGMSGGVDSSVSAYLLKKQGFDVTGVFIKVWQPDFIECTWREDRLDAMRVAAQLDIPFVTLDLEKEYKEGVIDYMIREYKGGRTPNPDVMCNREVKFGAFYRWAHAQGADYVATGHYAQHDNSSLMVSADEEKDQTYFLWTLSKEVIPSVMFPIGHLTKKEVRHIAEEAGLPVARKKDSQGLCFVGAIDLKTLLKHYIVEERGDVCNEEGEVIGYHEGVMFYTLGERHGFVITKKTDHDKPYFVVGKNLEKNILIVSTTQKAEKKDSQIILEDVSFTEEPRVGAIYHARARYRAPLKEVLCISNSEFMVKEEGFSAVTGQSFVIYDGERCIGGGIIV